MADGQVGTTAERNSSWSKTSGGKESVKESAREMKDQAKHKAEDLTAEAREKGREMAREGKARARTQAEQQKDRVSDGLLSVADALRRGGEEMPEDQRQYSRFLDAVADRAEDASHFLAERDVDALSREVRTFARAHAPVFLSGAFTLGMLGARFLKSSPSRDSYDYDRLPAGDYDRSSPGGNAYGGYGAELYAPDMDGQESFGRESQGYRAGPSSQERFGAPGDYEIDEPTDQVEPAPDIEPMDGTERGGGDHA